MTKYRLKASVIETILVKEAIELATTDLKSLPKWLFDAHTRGNVIFTSKKLLIQKDRAYHSHSSTEWIEVDNNGILTMDHKGQLNAYNIDIFENHYEKVE